MDAFEASANVPREGFEFDRRPETDRSFENALDAADPGSDSTSMTRSNC